MTSINNTLDCAIAKQFLDSYQVYLSLSPVTGESSPIILCGVLTVADLDDLRLDSPLTGTLDLLAIAEPT